MKTDEVTMDWFDYCLLAVLLISFVWILKKFFFRTQSIKTKHLEVNNDLTDKNKVDEREHSESLSENSCLNFDKLKDSEPSKFIDTTDSFEDEECFKTCSKVSYSNGNQEINTTNVLECSGYGTNEEEVRNDKLNTHDKSQDNFDIRNSLLKTIPRETIQRKHSNSVVNHSFNMSFAGEIDSQKSNLESTEDEGNESQAESSQEDLKKKVFFSDRKHKKAKRFSSIEISDNENNENAQPLTDTDTEGSHQSTHDKTNFKEPSKMLDVLKVGYVEIRCVKYTNQQKLLQRDLKEN